MRSDDWLNRPPLGATLLPSGECRFRVWAPKLRRLQVRLLGEPNRTIDLHRSGDGYFEATAPNVQSGDRYCFLLDGTETARPDPCSFSQPDGVHEPSEIIDPYFEWKDQNYLAVELSNYVIYELHVGTFTPEGTFDSAIRELDRLCDLGITAIEVMPVAQCPGNRNWGYDGVYPFAVQASFGGANAFKRFINECHRRGLAIILDVVYNHLGPEGNYLREFGPYFTDHYRTPWGEALNFDGAGNEGVREFFISNALRWQTEFRIDALRLDAVHAITDFSAIPFLAELKAVTLKQSQRLNRPFYLIAESDLNDGRLVRSPAIGGFGLDSAWADDLHHALHSLLTNERDGYYEDFGELDHLVKAYRTGFTYAGDYSKHRTRRHGNSPEGLLPHNFVVCSQNHDQVGNRARGERLSSLIDFESQKLAASLVLLSPYLPLIFMGEEYGESAPFLYFVSHGDSNLIEAVRKGRREEFSKFVWQGEIPDPQAEETFQRSKLDTSQAAFSHGSTLHLLYRELLKLRKSNPGLNCTSDYPSMIIPHLPSKSMLVHRISGDQQAILIFHFGKQLSTVRWSWPKGNWRLWMDTSSSLWGGPKLESKLHWVSLGELEFVQLPRSAAIFTLNASESE